MKSRCREKLSPPRWGMQKSGKTQAAEWGFITALSFLCWARARMLQDSLSLLREAPVHILQHLHLPRALCPLSPHGAWSRCPVSPCVKGLVQRLLRQKSQLRSQGTREQRGAGKGLQSGDPDPFPCCVDSTPRLGS